MSVHVTRGNPTELKRGERVGKMANEKLTETELHLLIQDLAMLVRRLVRKHPNEKLVEQAKGFLRRKGLEGQLCRAGQNIFEETPPIDVLGG